MAERDRADPNAGKAGGEGLCEGGPVLAQEGRSAVTDCECECAAGNVLRLLFCAAQCRVVLRCADLGSGMDWRHRPGVLCCRASAPLMRRTGSPVRAGTTAKFGGYAVRMVEESPVPGHDEITRRVLQAWPLPPAFPPLHSGAILGSVL